MRTFLLLIEEPINPKCTTPILSMQPGQGAEVTHLSPSGPIDETMRVFESPELSPEAQKFITTDTLSVMLGINHLRKNFYEKIIVPQVSKELAYIGWDMRGKYTDIFASFVSEECPSFDIIGECEKEHLRIIKEDNGKEPFLLRKRATHFVLSDHFVHLMNFKSLMLGWQGHARFVFDKKKDK